ncbi:glycosyltransferase family 9 protein [Halomonas sp. E19]|uniref:glycosyltransferase family 9 protein n=1 Tax=Halomonas sp. E19 TaxID=3397247 RepID=UPI004034512F
MTSSSPVAAGHAVDSPLRILVVRNDKLGDFMLAWPALACLKAALPEARLSVLVPSYTAPLARCCPWIDEVILDPGPDAGRRAQRELLAELRSARFTAMLTLFSTPRIGWLGWRAGIRHRLAPATKWAQLFYNHRIVQRRSRSAQPEYLYNIELAEALVAVLGERQPRARRRPSGRCRPVPGRPGARRLPPSWALRRRVPGCSCTPAAAARRSILRPTAMPRWPSPWSRAWHPTRHAPTGC